MQKLEKLYEGKAKMVFRTDDPELLIVEYKDDATAFNGEKRGTIAGKGVINNRVTNHLMTLLEEQGVPTHFVRELSDRETLVKKVTIVPLEVIVRNISAGSFAKRYGVEEGIVFDAPTIEFSYKNDDLGDPLMNAYHAVALKAATREEIETIKAMAFKVNEVMKQYFDTLNVILVDFKLEFGKTADGKIVLADEISPDTCRLWDKTTKEKLDKDRFRRDMGGVEEAYQEMIAALREKLDGVDRREKFRLRYYGERPDFLKLEKKFKVNGLCGKRSARLTWSEAERLLSGEDAFLLERGEPLLSELYHKLRGTLLRPRTVVCYDREAFLYAPGNVRVTLDRDLRTCGDSAGFLSTGAFPLRPLEGVTVLEVKYDAFLPDLVRLAVQTPGRRAGACSKYALCRRFD